MALFSSKHATRSGRRSLARGLSVLVAAWLVFGATAQLHAADFYAIIANLNNAKKPHAQIDVSIDTQALASGPLDILFEVFSLDGTVLASFAVPTNADGFASSSSAGFPNDNLFAWTGGLPALVRVHTPQGVASSAATLRKTTNSDMVLKLLPARQQNGTSVALGTQFAFAMGEIPHGATLLVANVSGADVNVDVFLGTAGLPGSGKHNDGRLQNRSSWIVELDQSDARSHMLVVSSGETVVQFAEPGGKNGNVVSEVAVLPAR
jgi:hypothetical protein